MIRTLENDQLRVQINDLGAELTEIYDKTNDRQVLWNADPSYWNRHAPGVSYSLRKDQNCSEMETRKRNTWLQNLQEDKWR